MGGRTFNEAWHEVLKATGKEGPKVGVIPTASSTLGEMGAEAVLVEIIEASCGVTVRDRP